MRTSVRTGELVGGVALPAQSHGSPSTRVLFDERSKETLSRVFCIAPGKSMLLSAYGLLEGDWIDVHRVVLQPGEINTACGECCETAELSTGPTVVRSKMLQECNVCVQMHVAQDELRLEGPGCYRLELASQFLLGRVYVEYQNPDEGS